MIGQPISNIEATGTSLEQADTPQPSYLQLIGCADVDFVPLSGREKKFEQWCEKNVAKDADRLARVAACTREIERDKLRVERETLIARRHGRGFRC